MSDPYMRHYVGACLVAGAVVIVGLLLVGSDVEAIGGAGSVLAMVGIVYGLYALVKMGLHLMRDDYSDAPPPQ